MNISSIPSEPTNSINVAVKVLDKNLETIEDLGQSLIKMMEQSVAPNLGQNVDIRI